jgi:hypothetical protein
MENLPYFGPRSYGNESRQAMTTKPDAELIETRLKRARLLDLEG